MTQSSGKIPRGFTRYYVLYLLSEHELTGKEIIDESIERSEGDWTPSPGLIYPLLGRLVRDGLIAELDGGKYKVTELGLKKLDNKEDFREDLESQLTLINKLGISMFVAGKFLADEAIKRISNISTTAWDNLTNRPDRAQRRFVEKYEQFLLEELERLNQEKMRHSPLSKEC